MLAVHEPAEGSAAATASAAPPAAPAAASNDPKVLLRRLMDSIPTSKDGVWSFSIRWDAYNVSSMADKFRWAAEGALRAGHLHVFALRGSAGLAACILCPVSCVLSCILCPLSSVLCPLSYLPCGAVFAVAQQRR